MSIWALLTSRWSEPVTSWDLKVKERIVDLICSEQLPCLWPNCSLTVMSSCVARWLSIQRWSHRRLRARHRIIKWLWTCLGSLRREFLKEGGEIDLCFAPIGLGTHCPLDFLVPELHQQGCVYCLQLFLGAEKSVEPENAAWAQDSVDVE